VSRSTLVRALYAGGTLLVLVLDQATKMWITSCMTLYSTTPIVPGFLHFTLVTNRGALFGFLHNLADPYRGLLFTSIPVMAILLILFFQFRTTIADSIAQTGLALILGGALGNLIDRLRLGYVIDFVDVFVGEHHWPAFNVADSTICVGVSLLVLDLLLKGRQEEAGLPPAV
jgi:signal peptidase II